MMTIDAIAAQAARHWPQITGAPKLFMQRENVVFRVDTTQGPHALRLHRPGYHATAVLQSELDLMAMLAARGVLVPTPAPSVSGALLVMVDGRQLSLLSWLDGEPMGRSGQPLAFAGAARAVLFANIGRQMARLHLLTDQWRPPSGFARPAWDRDGLLGDAPFWGRFWDHGTATDRALLVSVRDRARTILGGAIDPDYGLIHADLVNENVLVDGDSVRFIDFDDSGFGFRLFDLATTLYKAVDEPDFAALQSALLQGYAERRPLPDLTHLPLFIVLRSLTYLGWIAARADEPGMAAKAERYLAIAKRVIATYLP
jgi:Ser/Thr protein kinase RdoA (MazF antagonist)